MSPPTSRGILGVLKALSGRDVATLVKAIHECQSIDERLPEGESALFHAVLSGRIEFVEAMLMAGADPNFRATEPAEDILDRTPLELAQQARFLMDWDRYQPIAELLELHGARDHEGHRDSQDDLVDIEAHARLIQSSRLLTPFGFLRRVRSSITRWIAMVSCRPV